VTVLLTEYLPGDPGEGVPDAHAPPVHVRGALDLVGRSGGAEGEIAAEACRQIGGGGARRGAGHGVAPVLERLDGVSRHTSSAPVAKQPTWWPGATSTVPNCAAEAASSCSWNRQRPVSSAARRSSSASTSSQRLVNWGTEASRLRV